MIQNVDYLADTDVWLDAIGIVSLDRNSPRGVLQNDIYSGNGPLTAQLVGQGTQHGKLNFAEDGGFSYVPDPGFTGEDSFHYVAIDGTEKSEVAMVTISVEPSGKGPTAKDDEYQTDRNTPLVVGLGGIYQTIAQSGFNDAVGMNSDSIPNSPYQFGETIHGRGTSEPDWGGAWRVSDGGCDCGYDLGKAENNPVWEGDGAVHLRVSQTLRETWIHRQWAEPQFDRFILEQRIRLPANGVLGSRPYGNGFGPVWSVSNGRFYAHDGDGHGGSTPLDTGFRVVPLAWHNVSLVVDVAHQTFEFYVDGKRFESPGPLHFRESPFSIQNVDYLADTDIWIDSIRMISLGKNPVAGVLLNDRSPDGLPLSATLVDRPKHGSLSFHSNGGFRYTPELDFEGTDYFTYQASDGNQDSNVAMVAIHVGSENGPGGRPSTLWLPLYGTSNSVGSYPEGMPLNSGRTLNEWQDSPYQNSGSNLIPAFVQIPEEFTHKETGGNAGLHFLNRLPFDFGLGVDSKIGELLPDS
jgi:hypothetical protein